MVQSQRDCRMPAVIAGQQGWDVDGTDGLDDADLQLPADQPADPGNRVKAVLGRCDGATGGW